MNKFSANLFLENITTFFKDVFHQFVFKKIPYLLALEKIHKRPG